MMAAIEALTHRTIRGIDHHSTLNSPIISSFPISGGAEAAQKVAHSARRRQ